MVVLLRMLLKLRGEGQGVESFQMRMALLLHLVAYKSAVEGRLLPTILSAALTTLCRAFLSVAEQLPCHMVIQLLRTLSATHW